MPEINERERPFAVGDRVRRINGVAIGGTPVGSVGTVDRVSPSDRVVYVTFDVRPSRSVLNYPANLERIEGDGRVESLAAGTETRERQPGEFFIGDRVEVIRNFTNDPPVGSEGIVRYVSDHGTAAVEFDPGTSGHLWHCDNRVSSRLGRYMEISHLRVVGDRQEKAPEPIKAFRLVRYTATGPEDIAGETFDNGREAAARASVLSAELGVKVEPRRNTVAQDWRQREGNRLTDGTYSPLPDGWDLEPVKDHFAHLSKQRGYIAFTRDEAAGQADRQSAKRAGAYVREFYPHLSSSQVERYSALVSCEGQLRLSQERVDFKRIYCSGPDSCMKDGFGHLPCHPAEVYAAGDLAIAWLEDDDGNVTSRCVVWPEKKLRTRCYGDVEKMRSVLAAAGYQAGNFYGAKILKIERDYDIVCPYIDECNSVLGSPAALHVTIEDDHLVISERGCHAHNTNGWLDRDDEDTEYGTCDRCEDETDEDDLSTVTVEHWHGRARERWCGSCFGDNTFYCSGLEEHVSDDVSSYQSGTVSYRNYSSLWIDQNDVFICDNDGCVYPNDQRVHIEGGESWSRNAFRSDGFTCAGSGLNFAKTEPHTTIDGLIYHDDHLPAGHTASEDPADAQRAA